MDGVALIAEQVTKHFGELVAIDALSFELPAGRVTGLLGPNGAGKSTTIRVAMGLMAPDSGSITWQGQPVAALDRRRVGYLPEQIGVYGRMPVDEHIAFFAELHGLSRRDAARAAAGWSSRLDLPPKSLVNELSKGNQQRVQLASALAHGPELVVLDEPFSGLDPIGQAFVEGVMTDLATEGATLILSSHEIERVERYCNWVTLIDRGSLRFDGTVEALRARHPQLQRRRLTVTTPNSALETALPELRPWQGEAPLPEGGYAYELPTTAMAAEDLMAAAVEHGARVTGLELVTPTMRELFVLEVAPERRAVLASPTAAPETP